MPILKLIEKQLFKIKLGKYKWGWLRKDLYRDINDFSKNCKLPENTLNFLRSEVKLERINKISVVIATKDRLEALKNYGLKGLLEQDFNDADYEIIIVDNNSKDGTFEYIKSLNDKKIICVREVKNGASAARNRGVNEASGEIVAFIDDDCLVDNKWLQRIYDFYAKDDYLFGQGCIYDEAYKTILNYLTTDDLDDRFFNLFYEGNISFRKKIFDYVSFNETMVYGKEGCDLISQIIFFWPDSKYYFDTFPIKHFRSHSQYRKSNSHELNQQAEKLDRKLYWLWFIRRYVLRRNSRINERWFRVKFWLREICFFPLEMLFVCDMNVLINSKIDIFKKMLKLKLYD